MVKQLPLTDALPTKGLPEGLYTLRIGDFTEDIYLGAVDDIIKTYQARCDTIGKTDRLDPCGAMPALKNTVHNGPKATFRLGRQKLMLFYVSQMEWNLRNAQPRDLPPSERTGTHLIAYRSPIDGQIQHYILHLPGNYDGSHPIPLVIVCPHNTRDRPFLTGSTIADVDWIRKLASFSDEMGFACLWPHARGRYYDVPIAFADVMDVLARVEKEHRIDARRIYLTGDCEGAQFAMGLAESYPDRFAALALMNTITGERFPTPYWKMAHDLTLRAENLRNIPVQLLHGKLLSTVMLPSVQSARFAEAAKAKGFVPDLEYWRAMRVGRREDACRLNFEFFRGKVAPEAPANVSFVTAQLKQDTPYLVRVESLVDAGEGGGGAGGVRSSQ